MLLTNNTSVLAWGRTLSSLAYCLQRVTQSARLGIASTFRTGCACSLDMGWGRQTHQRLWFEILDDGVLPDREVVLVAAEEQAVVH